MRNVISLLIASVAMGGFVGTLKQPQVQAEPTPAVKPQDTTQADVKVLGDIAASQASTLEAALLRVSVLEQTVAELMEKVDGIKSCECGVVSAEENAAHPGFIPKQEAFQLPAGATWEIKGGCRVEKAPDGRKYYVPLGGASVLQGGCANGQCGTVRRGWLFK